MGFLCVLLKMYHVRFFIVEKMGFGMAPRRCGIHSKPHPLLQKTCLFHASQTLAVYIGLSLHMHALAFIHKLLTTYISCGLFWSFISKNKFLCI